MILAISGVAGSGKDTLANIIIDLQKKDNIISTKNKIGIKSFVAFQVKKFADPLKHVCSIITGLPIEHFYDREYYNAMIPNLNMTIREFMQKMGTEVGRNINENVWCYALLGKYQSHRNWIITDTRFENEAGFVKMAGGYLIKITRPEHQEITIFGDQKNHASETGLSSYKEWDYEVVNDGTEEDLIAKIYPFLVKIGVCQMREQNV